MKFDHIAITHTDHPLIEWAIAEYAKYSPICDGGLGSDIILSGDKPEKGSYGDTIVSFRKNTIITSEIRLLVAFPSVVLHELGHALGLPHFGNGVMSERFQYLEELQRDDIMEIQKLYRQEVFVSWRT